MISINFTKKIKKARGDMLVIEPGRERQTGANRQETELLHIVSFVGGFSLFYFLWKKN